MKITAISILLLVLLSSASSQSTQSCDTEGAVRLINGSSPLEGRVDLCMNGVWGSVCNDDWDYLDARVVCNQLGRQLNVDIFSAVDRGTFFNQAPADLPIHLTNVRCTGSETSLVNCIHTDVQTRYCTHYQDAGVTCILTNSTLLPVCMDALTNYTGTTVPFACPQPVNGRPLCLNASRYSSSSVCNGDTECGDCSDECHCTRNSRERPTFSCRRNRALKIMCNCTRNEFQCDNGFCVPREWMCNQRDGCGDGSDETNQECIDLARRQFQEVNDEAEVMLGLTLGLSFGLPIIIVLLIVPFLALCMLVPQCPMRKLYSTKPMVRPGTGTGEGESGRRAESRVEVGERSPELERSGAPLIADNQNETAS